MKLFYQKHGQNPDFDLQNIFISKIILKFENRICSILHCPTRFEMSQLARTSQLSKREIHVRNRETGIETRETRNETRETKVETSLSRGVIGYETGGQISGMLKPIFQKIGFFCLSAPRTMVIAKIIPNCHGRIFPARWGKILFPFRLSWPIRPVSPLFGVGSRRDDGPSPRCPGRSGRRPSKSNHVAFVGSRRPSRRGRRRGEAAVPGFDRQGARWVLPRSGEPGAAEPAGPAARWALPRRGDL